MTGLDLDQARRFLEHFRPDGHTTFVAIVPDGSTVAATFNGADPSDAVKWIAGQNRARNVYFTCNPTSPDLRKKPHKEDITEILPSGGTSTRSMATAAPGPMNASASRRWPTR